MIWRPRKGQAVVVWYNRRAAPFLPHHGEAGIVERVARGPGPRNVEVRFADGVRMIVPRGNLFRADAPMPRSVFFEALEKMEECR